MLNPTVVVLCSLCGPQQEPREVKSGEVRRGTRKMTHPELSCPDPEKGQGNGPELGIASAVTEPG